MEDPTVPECGGIASQMPHLLLMVREELHHHVGMGTLRVNITTQCCVADCRLVVCVHVSNGLEPRLPKYIGLRLDENSREKARNLLSLRTPVLSGCKKWIHLCVHLLEPRDIKLEVILPRVWDVLRLLVFLAPFG